MNREKRNQEEKVFMDMDAVLRLLEKARQKQPVSDRVMRTRKFEEQTYREQRRDTPIWDAAEKALQPAVPAAESLSQDVFQILYSQEPQFNPEASISPRAKAFNKPVLEKITGSDEYEELRGVTTGNAELSAEAAQQFILSLSDSIKGALTNQDDRTRVFEQLQRRKKALQEKLGRLTASPHTAETDEKIRRTAAMLQNTLSQIGDQEKRAADALVISGTGAGVVSALRDALAAAGELKNVCDAWGNGVASLRSSAVNRKLLETVRDNSRLKEISRYLGRLRELLRLRRKNGFTYGRGEPFTIVRGNSLEDILPSELAGLASPLTLPLFLRDYLDGNLMQYRRRDRICKGKGDIIACLDESGSTSSYGNAEWGMAVALALLEAAGHENRKFALIHFSAESDIRTDIFLPGRYNLENILNTALHFFNGGGTDFERPLREAVEVLRSKDFRNADIVFITDGQCSISESFRVWLRSTKAELKCTITGVLMDQDGSDREFSLEPFCEHIYRLSELGADRIADILVNEHAS